MPSALVAMVLSFFNVPSYVQVLVFTVLSALFIIFSRTLLGKTLHPKHTPTNADSVIGESAVVTEQVCNIENRGLVKVRGQIWSARSADGDVLEPGEIVSVISIEGVKLICRKETKEN
jgi:membrane protein implicated in regulation of membrane protease activity